MSAAPNPRPPEARQPIVCYVTDRLSLGVVDPIAELLGKVRLAAHAGADWVQIREKDLPARALLNLTRAAIAVADELCQGTASAVPKSPSGSGTLAPEVFVNDRLDIAVAAGAAGVHLGGESIPVGDAVRWCKIGNAPPQFQVGASCHSLEEAREAERAGASYLFFGPVFDTPSKKIFGPSQGVERLAEVCAAIRIPVVAIGGVHEENAPACIRRGAGGIAAIRMFQVAQSADALRESIARLHAL